MVVSRRSAEDQLTPTVYQICVRGRLTERMAAALEGMTLHAGTVNTVFTHEVKDESQLYNRFLLQPTRCRKLIPGRIPLSEHPDKVFWIQSPERLVLLPEPGDAVIRDRRHYCDDNTRASSRCHTEEHRRPGSWPQITRVILIHG